MIKGKWKIILQKFVFGPRPQTLMSSVMQSDGNRFGGDVVFDSFNKASRDEQDILDQIYKSKYVCIIFLIILILYTKMLSNTTVVLKPIL